MIRVLLFCLLAGPIWADDVIVIGSPGTEEYRERFSEWADRLSDVLVDKLERSQDQVHLVNAGQGKGLEKIRELLNKLAKSHSKQKDLFVYLVGHGSHLRGESKFQIAGPDLTATELDRLLDKIPSARMILINGASSSAGFINRLSGPDRIICTATKSTREVNATEFMEFFIQSLEEGLADRNRDERISVWEAASQAAALTESWYLGNGLIATEHAILDDNGDDLGTRLHVTDASREPRDKGDRDGELADLVFIKDFSFPDKTPPTLIDEYLNLVKQAEALAKRRDKMKRADFYQQLESLMIKAARAHRKIRAYREP